ncbi:MAG TPA: hypothetical protein VNC40_15470 [Gaiellaceae bacterium]|nr:hypothetical protein [Gaiellaceae bacterium]
MNTSAKSFANSATTRSSKAPAPAAAPPGTDSATTSSSGPRHSGRNDTRRRNRPSAKRLREPRYLDRSEIDRLLEKIGDEFRPVAATLAFAARRVSEALALRCHSCAGLLLSAGIPVPKVAAILRHADARITLTVYAGVVESQRAELRDDLEAALR